MRKQTSNSRSKPNKKRPLRKTSGQKTRSKYRKGKKKTASQDIPRWLFYVLSVAIAIVFLSLFYYFFIRPYSYRWKPCYGLKAYGVCMPAGHYVHGIDLSHYQGTVKWNQLISAKEGEFPIRFIFMKASEGGDLKDETFQANFDSARANGFIRGAYHFFNPKTDPDKQADFYIGTVRLDSLDLPPVLDIEQRTDNNAKLRENVKIWLKKVEEHYGVKPIIYASYKYKTRYLNDSTLNSYPYWIAHYYVDSVAYKGQWKFWQHTDVGTLPGIKEKVDLDVFNGTLDELKALTIRKRM